MRSYDCLYYPKYGRILSKVYVDTDRLNNEVKSLLDNIDSDLDAAKDCCMRAYSNGVNHDILRVAASKILNIKFQVKILSKKIKYLEKIVTAPIFVESSGELVNTGKGFFQPIEINNSPSEVDTSTKDEKISISVPTGVSTYFKSYTAYTAVTTQKLNTGCYVYKQSAILYGACPGPDGISYNTYTDSETHVRCVDINGEKYYCAAMGNYYGNVGDRFVITTDKGNQFNVIVCDAKNSKDSTAYLIDGKSAGHIQQGG